jgi:hypothetical protein
MKTWFMKRTTLIELWPHGWHLTSTKLVSWMKQSSSMWLIPSIHLFSSIQTKSHPLGRLYLYHYILSCYVHVINVNICQLHPCVMIINIACVNQLQAMWSSSTMWSKSVNVNNNTIQVHKFIQTVIFFSFMQLIPILSHELQLCCCFDFIHVAIAFEWMSIFVHFIIFHVCGDFHHMMNSIL